jgi:protein-S-isoprenylcysteine O-methyltransferase Ste14
VIAVSVPIKLRTMKTSFWTTLACSLGYLVLVVVCLAQWHHRLLLQLDYFSGGYLAMRLLGSIYSLSSSRMAFHSSPVKKQWWALDSDPAGPHSVMLLMALDLIVFIDYGHWRFTPWLMRPTLQIIGLALYLAVTIWQIWTDVYLARYFNKTQTQLVPMNRGPYQYVRHPRYGAAIAGKIAMALTFGSLFGWLLVIAWGLLLLNKIEIEEKHLRKMFGPPYESYARTTAKVIPGIY